MKYECRHTIPVLDAVSQIRETQIEREGNLDKQEVSPWHGYTTHSYFSDYEYRVQGVGGNAVPSYHEDQSDGTNSGKDTNNLVD